MKKRTQNHINIGRSAVIFTSLFIFFCTFSFSCNNDRKEEKPVKKDSVKVDSVKITTEVTTPDSAIFSDCVNDSLNELAQLIAGINPGSESKILKDLFNSKMVKEHSDSFSKKWMKFESDRMKVLKDFRTNEISKEVVASKTLLYPFSGPDILYAYTFFPDVERYVMMGLEPIGTRVVYDEDKIKRDSLNRYFDKINKSLHAILSFSFFRTASMSSDLRNQEVDGTQHLLLLFLARTGNKICSMKPIYIDSLGNMVYVKSFPFLKKSSFKNKGIEIVFTNQEGRQKTVNYFSLDLSNEKFSVNPGMQKFISSLGEVNSYFKGASYLMHGRSFSQFRDMVINQSNYIIEDDSGIPLRFINAGGKWEIKCYGNYTSPIKMFAQFYQSDLDTLFKTNGSKELGFGIGYKYKNNTSNLIIAKKLK